MPVLYQRDTGADFLYTPGLYLFGYYTTDYEDAMVCIAQSRNNGSYIDKITILRDSTSGYNYNSDGTFIPRNPITGKTYKYFKIKLG